MKNDMKTITIAQFKTLSRSICGGSIASVQIVPHNGLAKAIVSGPPKASGHPTEVRCYLLVDGEWKNYRG
tara:strand:+ start:747 stop:956 length:210 start_codon:yes stop_codon:yes gene_type:complete